MIPKTSNYSLKLPRGLVLDGDALFELINSYHPSLSYPLSEVARLKTPFFDYLSQLPGIPDNSTMEFLKMFPPLRSIDFIDDVSKGKTLFGYGLPSPYSDDEIQSFKLLAESINRDLTIVASIQSYVVNLHKHIDSIISSVRLLLKHDITSGAKDGIELTVLFRLLGTSYITSMTVSKTFAFSHSALQDMTRATRCAMIDEISSSQSPTSESQLLIMFIKSLRSYLRDNMNIRNPKTRCFFPGYDKS